MHPLLENKSRDALRAHRAVGRGHRDARVGVYGVRDEVLRAVDDPLAAAADGGRARARSVGACLRLGQAPRAELLAPCERHQKLLLLLLRAEHEDVVRAERVVRGYGDADRAVNARKLFDDRDVLDVTHPRAAVLFGEDDAHKALLGELRQQLHEEVLRLVPLAHVRRDLALGEFAHAHLYLPLIFVQLEVHKLVETPRYFLARVEPAHRRRARSFRSVCGTLAACNCTWKNADPRGCAGRSRFLSARVFEVRESAHVSRAARLHERPLPPAFRLSDLGAVRRAPDALFSFFRPAFAPPFKRATSCGVKKR